MKKDNSKLYNQYENNFISKNILFKRSKKIIKAKNT